MSSSASLHSRARLKSNSKCLYKIGLFHPKTYYKFHFHLEAISPSRTTLKAGSVLNVITCPWNGPSTTSGNEQSHRTATSRRQKFEECILEDVSTTAIESWADPIYVLHLQEPSTVPQLQRQIFHGWNELRQNKFMRMKLFSVNFRHLWIIKQERHAMH